ncbi:MAG TPA: copper amine oxidase N-terminal domain-containing protein, partial [Clostridia bacterium]|nr:copper amine oxidase N-terminal domain-containing protein [Clostridia bacterium]
AEEKTWLNLGAKALSAAEKKEIIESALRQGCGLEDIGVQVVELKAEIVKTEEKEEVYTETITGFPEPVQITLDLSGLEITEEDVNLLTAVRYVKDRWGNLQAVKLGGTYDVTSEKFTFYTENFSLYSVVKAEDLLKIVLVINEPEVLINNTKKKVDVPACLIENRTMVPLRFVAEGMGAEVQWKEDIRTVEMHFQDKLLKLVVGKTGPGLEVPAMIEEGRTLVPLRYVVNNLGATVTWFPATQTVMVVK